MKPIYKTISLTTLALVAAFAVTARANGPRDLYRSSAAQNPGHAVAQAPAHPIINQAPPGSLWYNGDFNDVNGLSNELNTSLGSGEFGSTYDNFIVTDSAGWNVTAVFSDDLTNTGITGANWEIRQGVSVGNGGTLIASGTTNTPVVTDTGRSGFGYIEHQVLVDGLNVCLNPGTYWLNVTVIGDLTDRAFVSTTSGADCVGTPCGNDQNAFFNSNFFGFNFASTGDPAIGQPYDFSMGVIGTVGCGGGLTYDSAFSEKGPWDIDLPLDGSGVEDRSGSSNKGYALYFVFNNALASVASATTTCGSVAFVGVDPDVANQAEVDLTGVGCNESEITVTADGIVDVDGNTLASASITFGLLVGDVNGDRVVDHGDYHLVKGFLGQRDDSTNFRADVAISGSGRGVINAADARMVKGQQGTSLP